MDVSPTSRDDLAGAYRDRVSNQGSEGAGHLALYDSCRDGLYHFHSIGVDVRRLDIQDDYPEGTPLDASSRFDSRLLNLFEEMSRKDPLQKRMADDFVRLKNQLGRRPWRYDMYERSDIPMRHYLEKGWLQFPASVDSLTDEEGWWLGTPAGAFLREQEKTPMTKSHKMPTIGFFITSDGSTSMSVPLSTVGEGFRQYYVTSKVHQRDLTDKSNRDWAQWTLEEFMSLARTNPVHFLSRSRFFCYDEVNRVFSLDASLQPYAGPTLASHIRDIVRYRGTNYFARRYRES